MLKTVLRFLTTSRNNHLDPNRIAPSTSLIGLLFSAAAIGAFSILFSKVRDNRTIDTDARIRSYEILAGEVAKLSPAVE